jgi:hypothetical protein
MKPVSTPIAMESIAMEILFNIFIGWFLDELITLIITMITITGSNSINNPKGVMFVGFLLIRNSVLGNPS